MRFLRIVATMSSLLALAGLAKPARANFCALPVGVSASAGLLTSTARTSALASGNTSVVATAFVSIGFLGGVATSTDVIIGLGLQNASRSAFTCFMSTDTPLAVSALPGSRSVMRLVPSPAKTMTLEWTDSFGPLPVTYKVFLGTNPIALSQIDGSLVGTQEPLSNLSFALPYYWRVGAADQFGRSAMSDIYSFSIAPETGHLIAAPNPMHPGHGLTSFLFRMNGAGAADIEIYSLPDIRRVFSRNYNGLQDGPNTIAYDGRDDGGRYLPNGVYAVIMRKRGANGNETERFKLVSAR